MLKTSIESGGYFDDQNYAEGLAKMGEHGFDAVDYSIAGKAVDTYSDAKYLEFLKDMKRKADDAGVKFYQMHGNTSPITAKPEYKVDDFFIRQLLTCRELDCKYLVIHPYTDDYILQADSHDTIFAKNKHLLDLLLPKAKEYGVTLCLENLPFRWFEMCRVTEVKKLIKVFDDENLKACLDTGHANVMRENVYDSIKLLGDDLKVLHVHDNYGGADDRHYYPYRGNVDWEGFYKGLNEINYKGTLNLETKVAMETPEPMRDTMRKGLYELAKYMASRVN